MIGTRQLNFLQNDVCFSRLGQKLGEKVHFSSQKCNFQGEGKTSNCNYVSNINVNNNKTTGNSISMVSISTDTSVSMVELFVTMARLAWGQTSVSTIKIGAICCDREKLVRSDQRV